MNAATTLSLAQPTLRSPAVRLVDEGRELRLDAQVPGIDRATLEVHVDGDLLSISAARREPAAGQPLFRERFEGAFLRVLRLPCAVDGDPTPFARRPLRAQDG